jgi:hypothetical protein
MKLHAHRFRTISLSILLAAVSTNTVAAVLASDVSNEKQFKPDIAELLSSAIKYEHSEGVPRDYVRAATLYCSAARLGNADAQFSLGWMYANGRGVARSESMAAALFSLAARHGHLGAKNMLQYTVKSKVEDLPKCIQPDTAVSLESNTKKQLTNNFYLSSKSPITKLVEKLSLKYGIDPQLVLAIISVESGFDVNARSPKNAQGLMQLIPETAQRFQVKNPFNAEENIKGGIAYLKWLLIQFKGNVQMVAAAYNAGEGAVIKYKGVPPFPETQLYVSKVSKLYQKANHPYQVIALKTSSKLIADQSF